MATPNNEELIENLEDALTEWKNYVEVDNAPHSLGQHAAPHIKVIKTALQSQAERIKELEALVVSQFDTEHPPTFRQGFPVHELEEAVTADQCTNLVNSIVTLRAELAAIAATEPSMIYHGRCIIDCGDSGHQDVTMLKMIARETKLFTHPMPAQDVTELVEAFEYHIEQTRPIERSTIALSKYKGAK